MSKSLIIIVIIFIGSYVLGLAIDNSRNENKKTSEFTLENCNPAKKECIIHVNKEVINVYFEKEPTPLSPFRARVSSNKLEILRVFLEIKMTGMDMGNNTYSFNKNNEVWESNIVLPICSLGRNDWQAKLLIETNKNIRAFNFSFSSRQ
jgi:hypothetical protein